MNITNPRELAEAGKKAYQEAYYLEAAVSFEQAAHAYRATGDELMAAEMQNNQSVALLQAKQPTEALSACQGTDAVFAAAGDTKRQALALGNQAAALEALSKIDAALEAYQRSADLLKAVGETELRSIVLKSLSALQIKKGRQLEALASMDAALAGKKKKTFKETLLAKLLRIPFKMMKR